MTNNYKPYARSLLVKQVNRSINVNNGNGGAIINTVSDNVDVGEKILDVSKDIDKSILDNAYYYRIHFSVAKNRNPINDTIIGVGEDGNTDGTYKPISVVKNPVTMTTYYAVIRLVVPFYSQQLVEFTIYNDYINDASKKKYSYVKGIQIGSYSDVTEEILKVSKVTIANKIIYLKVLFKVKPEPDRDPKNDTSIYIEIETSTPNTPNTVKEYKSPIILTKMSNSENLYYAVIDVSTEVGSSLKKIGIYSADQKTEYSIATDINVKNEYEF